MLFLPGRVILRESDGVSPNFSKNAREKEKYISEETASYPITAYLVNVKILPSIIDKHKKMLQSFYRCIILCNYNRISSKVKGETIFY